MTDPTPQATRLNAATARVATAKAFMTAAAQAALNGKHDAEHMAQSALIELDNARADLKRLQDAPEPVGMWAEYARMDVR